MAAVQTDFQFGSAPFICFINCGVFLVPANGNIETSMQNTILNIAAWPFSHCSRAITFLDDM